MASVGNGVGAGLEAIRTGEYQVPVPPSLPSATSQEVSQEKGKEGTTGNVLQQELVHQIAKSIFESKKQNSPVVLPVVDSNLAYFTDAVTREVQTLEEKHNLVASSTATSQLDLDKVDLVEKQLKVRCVFFNTLLLSRSEIEQEECIKIAAKFPCSWPLFTQSSLDRKLKLFELKLRSFENKKLTDSLHSVFDAIKNKNPQKLLEFFADNNAIFNESYPDVTSDLFALLPAELQLIFLFSKTLQGELFLDLYKPSIKDVSLLEIVTSILESEQTKDPEFIKTILDVISSHYLRFFYQNPLADIFQKKIMVALIAIAVSEGAKNELPQEIEKFVGKLILPTSLLHEISRYAAKLAHSQGEKHRVRSLIQIIPLFVSLLQQGHQNHCDIFQSFWKEYLLAFEDTKITASLPDAFDAIKNKNPQKLLQFVLENKIFYEKHWFALHEFMTYTIPDECLIPLFLSKNSEGRFFFELYPEEPFINGWFVKAAANILGHPAEKEPESIRVLLSHLCRHSTICSRFLEKPFITLISHVVSIATEKEALFQAQRLIHVAILLKFTKKEDREKIISSVSQLASTTGNLYYLRLFEQCSLDVQQSLWEKFLNGIGNKKLNECLPKFEGAINNGDKWEFWVFFENNKDFFIEKKLTVLYLKTLIVRQHVRDILFSKNADSKLLIEQFSESQVSVADRYEILMIGLRLESYKRGPAFTTIVDRFVKDPQFEDAIATQAYPPRFRSLLTMALLSRHLSPLLLSEEDKKVIQLLFFSLPEDEQDFCISTLVNYAVSNIQYLTVFTEYSFKIRIKICKGLFLALKDEKINPSSFAWWHDAMQKGGFTGTTAIADKKEALRDSQGKTVLHLLAEYQASFKNKRGVDPDITRFFIHEFKGTFELFCYKDLKGKYFFDYYPQMLSFFTKEIIEAFNTRSIKSLVDEEGVKRLFEAIVIAAAPEQKKISEVDLAQLCVCFKNLEGDIRWDAQDGAETTALHNIIALLSKYHYVAHSPQIESITNCLKSFINKCPASIYVRNQNNQTIYQLAGNLMGLSLLMPPMDKIITFQPFVTEINEPNAPPTEKKIFSIAVNTDGLKKALAEERDTTVAAIYAMNSIQLRNKLRAMISKMEYFGAIGYLTTQQRVIGREGPLVEDQIENFFLLDISPEHYSKKIADISIESAKELPEPKAETTMQEAILLLHSINFTDRTKKESYCDPEQCLSRVRDGHKVTREELEKAFCSMMKKIEDNEPLTGLAQDNEKRKEEYAYIKKGSLLCIEKLKELPHSLHKGKMIIQLFVRATACGTRYLQIPKLYDELTGRVYERPFDEESFHSLYQMRIAYFENEARLMNTSNMEVHTAEAVKHFFPEEAQQKPKDLSNPGSIEVHLDSAIRGMQKNNALEHLRVRYTDFYAAQMIINHIRVVLEQHPYTSDTLMDWISSHPPTDWKKEKYTHLLREMETLQARSNVTKFTDLTETEQRQLEEAGVDTIPVSAHLVLQRASAECVTKTIHAFVNQLPDLIQQRKEAQDKGLSFQSSSPQLEMLLSLYDAEESKREANLPGKSKREIAQEVAKQYTEEAMKRHTEEIQAHLASRSSPPSPEELLFLLKERKIVIPTTTEELFLSSYAQGTALSWSDVLEKARGKAFCDAMQKEDPKPTNQSLCYFLNYQGIIRNYALS